MVKGEVCKTSIAGSIPATASMDIKLFVATKAFVRHEGKLLILRESAKYDDGSNEGRYDVPGGRVVPGQRFDESLRREIREETGLEVAIGRPFFTNEWRPVVRGEQWQIIGTFFVCESSINTVMLGEDHDSFLWIDPVKYKDYPLIENLRPAFEAYLETV